MGKRVFALMLNSAILTTNALFAMDLPDKEKEGIGNLAVLSKELITTCIIKPLPVRDVVSLSEVSKTFHGLSTSDDIWEPLSTKLGFNFKPPLIKYQILSIYGGNFLGDPEKNYPLLFPVFLSLIKNSLPGIGTTVLPDRAQKWEDVKLWGRSYCMTYIEHTQDFRNILPLPDFSKIDHELMMFSKTYQGNYFECIFTLVTDEDNTGGILPRNGYTPKEKYDKEQELLAKFPNKELKWRRFTFTIEKK